MDVLRQNLQYAKGELRKDKDWLHVNDGYERSGKSDIALQESTEIQPEILDSMASIKKFVEKQITFTSKEFEKAINRANRYDVVMADEGAEAFLNTDSMKADNIDNKKLLTKIGAKNLFIIINVPDIFLLEPYIRGHRIKSLCHITSRGHIAVYSKERIKKISRDKETRSTIYPSPNFYDTFNKLEGRKGLEGKLWEFYRQRKMDYLSRRSLADKLAAKADSIMERTFSHRETAKILKVSKYTIKSWIKIKKLKTIKTPSGRKMIPESEINRLLNFYKKQTDKLEEREYVEA